MTNLSKPSFIALATVIAASVLLLAGLGPTVAGASKETEWWKAQLIRDGGQKVVWLGLRDDGTVTWKDGGIPLEQLEAVDRAQDDVRAIRALGVLAEQKKFNRLLDSAECDVLDMLSMRDDMPDKVRKLVVQGLQKCKSSAEASHKSRGKRGKR